MNKFIEVVLTCGSWQEAQKIADRLLEAKLVACVEFLEVKSRFHWKDSLENANEIKLVMTSIADHFAPIEAEIKKLHSYEAFVLKQIPLTYINKAAREWLEIVLQKYDNTIE